MKLRAEWMRKSRFGLTDHWFVAGSSKQWGAPPQHGPRVDNLDQAVNRFDIDRFIDDYRASGAEWMIFSIAQNTGYYASPNSVLDRLAGQGHCSQRDLVLEIAQRVKALGHRFIAYLPGDIYPQTEAMQDAFGWSRVEGAIQDEFKLRYAEFIREYAPRFGPLLDGWWFDGGSHLLQPGSCHLVAGRAGNPAAALAFNNGSLCCGMGEPLHTEQDYLAGEVEVLIGGQVRLGRAKDAPLLAPATHPQQPPANCLWHALVPIDCMWGHGGGFEEWMHSPMTIATPPPDEMELPLYSAADLHRLVQDFKAAGGGVTFNVGIFQEGGLGIRTVERMAELALALG
jgi:hypothetical protein